MSLEVSFKFTVCWGGAAWDIYKTLSGFLIYFDLRLQYLK